MKYGTLTLIALLSLFLLSPGECLGDSSGAFHRPLIFGINEVAGFGGFAREPEGYDEVKWDRLREVGSACIRMAASWREIEAVRGIRDWSVLDHLIERTREIGAEPILLIVNVPGWASPTGEPTHMYPPREDVTEEYMDFCTEMAVRYRGKVQYYEIWNEQNGFGWHTDAVFFSFADEYIPWLRRSFHGLKKGDPDCRVALGGMCNAGGNAWMYLERFYHFRDEWYPGEVFWDAIADHPYSYNMDAMRKKLDDLREVMRKNGDEDTPFWITEYGWHTRDTREDGQARAIQEFLEQMTSPRFEDVEIASYLCIGDFEGNPVGFGVCDTNLRPRSAFTIYRDHEKNLLANVYRLEAVPIREGEVEIRFRVKKADRIRGEVTDAGGSVVKTYESGGDRLEHSLLLSDLIEGATYRAAISTEGPNNHQSIEFHAPMEDIWNGTFEDGFQAGIARGWGITGEAFCFSTADFHPPQPEEWSVGTGQDGSVGQLLAVRGRESGRTHRLTALGWTQTAAEPGGTYEFSMAFREGPGEGGRIRFVLGIDPTGGLNPHSGNVIWGESTRAQPDWKTATVQAMAQNWIITLFFVCEDREEDRDRKFMVLDNACLTRLVD